MWSREKLAELVEKRRGTQELIPRAEEATLAYARWQGLTAEDDVDRDKAKATLDGILDATEPQDWSHLKELVGEIDDQIVKGVMHYALTRSLGQLREQQREYAEPAAEPTDDAPDAKSRRRDRSRGR
jgi:hypothetical protein